MVAILRCNRDEEKLLWEKSADPNASAKGWVTARPTDNWKGRDVVLIVTSPAARPMITHAGSLRKGSWRGTVLRELSVTGVEELPGPCPMDVLGERVPPYVRKHLEGERTLPDQAGRELLSVLLEMRPEWGAILDRLSEPEPPVQIRGPRGEQVGLVRDAVGLVLQMAGFSREPLELWTPPADLEAPDAPSFLDGLPEGVALEDDLIAHDARRFRDWLGQDTSHHGWRVYTKNGQRLLIGNVNRKPAEATLGVDLIYLNESRQSTVLVQYKKLIKKDGDWSYYPARDRDNLEKELARMRDVAAMCEKVTDENDAYRLHSDPCWFKLCRAESTIPARMSSYRACICLAPTSTSSSTPLTRLCGAAGAASGSVTRRSLATWTTPPSAAWSRTGGSEAPAGPPRSSKRRSGPATRAAVRSSSPHCSARTPPGPSVPAGSALASSTADLEASHRHFAEARFSAHPV